MHRHVTSRIELDVAERADLVLAVAVSSPYAPQGEELVVELDGASVDIREITDGATRLHRVSCPPGRLVVRYRASVDGRCAPLAVTPRDEIVALRPSRYAESDELAATAVAEFDGVDGPEDLLAAVSSWVGTRLAYVPGSSQPTDGAVRTLLARRGVCRDFAHVTVALLRALGVPARLVAVYAPGLDPMDFHAVVEALVDGQWRVVDATTLAPRSTLVRIATGRDAADTAFLTVQAGRAELDGMEVTAVADTLPDDDLDALVSIG